MYTITTTLPLARLDHFWAEILDCQPDDLRAGALRLVPCGQRQIQVLATPDGAVVIGLPWLIERAERATTAQVLDPQQWADWFDLPLAALTFYGPGSLSYVRADDFQPHDDPLVRPLRREDAGELARFARILQAREPNIFHSWAIGGRVTANERLWGAYDQEKIVSVAGLRPVAKRIFEVGINTLPRHRRKGWGTAVASAATAGGLARADLVQWSAPLRNEPSIRLARRLGYHPYAHQLWLALPDHVITRQ